MKKAIATLAAVAAIFAVSNAQLVQEQDVDPAKSFSWKQTSDGSSIVALNAWTLHEVYFALPFGLDASFGHEVWLGTRTRIDRIADAEGVFGYDVYGLKDLGSPIGGLQFFLKGEIGVAIGPRTETNSAFTGYAALSVGARF